MKVTQGKSKARGNNVASVMGSARGRKRKLEEDDWQSDSTSVSSVMVIDANTSSDMSLRDILSDHPEEEDKIEVEVKQME